MWFFWSAMPSSELFIWGDQTEVLFEKKTIIRCAFYGYWLVDKSKKKGVKSKLLMKWLTFEWYAFCSVVIFLRSVTLDIRSESIWNFQNINASIEFESKRSQKSSKLIKNQPNQPAPTSPQCYSIKHIKSIRFRMEFHRFPSDIARIWFSHKQIDNNDKSVVKMTYRGKHIAANICNSIHIVFILILGCVPGERDAIRHQKEMGLWLAIPLEMVMPAVVILIWKQGLLRLWCIIAEASNTLCLLSVCGLPLNIY